MKLRTRLIILLAGPVMYAVACSSPNAPAERAGIVFRFVPERNAMHPARAGGIEDALDSVVVRVFRPGSPIAQEVARGASVGVDPVEMTIACIAEANKRVSVELFASGVMVYHGVNEDVDVVASRATDVLVDAFPFHVDALSATPEVVPDGSSFDLAWSSTTGARTYRIEASATPDFAIIEWTQSLADTVASATLPPGAHYFRVAPATPFATGAFAGPEPGYVTGGSGSVIITGFSAPGVIPGETVSLYGENLDYPGTQVLLGSTFMEIVSASWGELVVRMPLAGRTDVVGWGSDKLGSGTTPDSLIALRVAYVTDGGTFAVGYADALEKHSDDFGESGVVTVPVAELDWRDMNVFDIVLVGHDAGTTESSWGGGVPARAAKIKESRSNVVAIGLGGATFLKLVGATNALNQTTVDPDGEYYVPNGGSAVFTDPHSVGGGFVKFCSRPPVTVDFAITNAPAGATLLASTNASGCPLLCNPNNRWALVEFRLVNPGGTPVIYFFWGYADDPAVLTSTGTDCLGNVMNLLFKSVSAATP
ncbi:MAG TPA: hypothetical protein VFT13_02710 [Candidatus Krumholzibacteria bacterium]|nr:hypothetical protein [Candidatus Krumholzibacteria bacterium]